jgi:ferrous iron transport protein A
MFNKIFLSQIPPGSSAVIKELLSEGIARRRLFDMGFVPETYVKVLQKSPAGDPVAYLARGSVVAIRNGDAERILVNPL